MSRITICLAAAALCTTSLEAQRVEPRPSPLVLGRMAALQPRRGDFVRGELLAARNDTVWVLGANGRIAAVSLQTLQDVSIQRHVLTPKRGLVWAAAVGVVSGVGLTAACSQISEGCGSVMTASIFSSMMFGGIAAMSFSSSSRRHFRPPTTEALARYARFPQGPPDMMDSLVTAPRDTARARHATR